MTNMIICLCNYPVIIRFCINHIFGKMPQTIILVFIDASPYQFSNFTLAPVNSFC